MGTLIVVEGKSDITFLQSFIDADFYKVNGSAVCSNDISFIKSYLRSNKENKVVILTDPDFPGKKIRNYLNENIDGLYNAYVKKELSIKHHKVGVAESTKDEVLRALNSAIKFENIKANKGDWNFQDLINLSLTGKAKSKELRDALSEKFNLGYNNAKSLLKKLNMLNISKDEVKEFLKNVK